MGTLAANLLGCLLIGILWALSTRFSFSQDVRAFLFTFTGGIGFLTTFSTSGVGRFMPLHDGKVLTRLGNILVSDLLGLALVALGFVCLSLLFDEQAVVGIA